MTQSGSGCLFPLSIFGVIFFGFLGFVGLSGFTAESESSRMEVAPPVVRSMSTVEIVFAPGQADVSMADWQAAQQIVEDRLLALADSGAITESFAIGSSSAEMQFFVEVNEAAMNADEIAETLTSGGYIEFVDFSAISTGIFDQYLDTSVVTSASVARSGDEAAGMVFPTVLTHEELGRAVAVIDDFGMSMVEVELTADGQELLRAFSQENLGNGMAVVLDGVVVTVPVIQDVIDTPTLVITANFTYVEAQALAVQINSRPLPVPLSVEAINLSN
ncbi:MAG: SecDF P1 head subdomain-containing protein [Chloroflexota bacterium]